MKERSFDKIKREALLGFLKRKAMKPLEMARYAYKNTLFYKNLYKEMPSDFKSLPLVRKEMVKEASPYDLLSKVLKNKVMWYGETTGSMGSPTPSFYTEKEFAGAYLLSLISPYNKVLKDILKENRTAINGLTLEFTIAGASFADLLVKNGALVANVGARSTIGPPERIARAIVRLKPSIIAGTPIDFLSWMWIVKEDYPHEYEDVLKKLKLLLSTAELCSNSRVSRIQEHFGIIHINTYATVEGFFTLTCPCSKKHILPAYYVELFDENLKYIGETGKGRLVITNLVKRSTPFVRYLLDDLVTIRETKPCSFGFSKNIIPHGRYELSLKAKDEIYNIGDIEEMLFNYGLFGDYSLNIFDDHIDVEIEEYGNYKIDGIGNELFAIFSIPCLIKMVPFGSLTPYREIRKTKPILKVMDKRSTASQIIPEIL
ncbi:MAG: phenylacetate--CoA ligase family protein [bacterium]